MTAGFLVHSVLCSYKVVVVAHGVVWFDFESFRVCLKESFLEILAIDIFRNIHQGVHVEGFVSAVPVGVRDAVVAESLEDLERCFLVDVLVVMVELDDDFIVEDTPVVVLFERAVFLVKEHAPVCPVARRRWTIEQHDWLVWKQFVQ